MADGVESKMVRRLRDEDDRISSIPDSLIHHILSFLMMDDVVQTSLLSRRWRNLWKTVPVLNFGNFRGDTTFIRLSLMHYNGRKIRRFYASFRCEIDSCHLDSWVRFAMVRDVEELDLRFFLNNYKFDSENFYKLPFWILDGGQFLKVLLLESCVLRFPKSFCFPSITKIHLCCVVFTDLDTSSCPLLEVLIFEGCSKSLNIHAPNQKLRYLRIHDDDTVLEKKCYLSLYAPNLLSIEFFGCFRGSYNCKNLSSIESAKLGFYDMEEYDFDFNGASLVGLLNSISCAKTLKLYKWPIQILGCAENSMKTLLPLNATVLEMQTTLDKYELTICVASLLRNAYCLETLILNIRDPKNQPCCQHCYFDDDNTWEPLELALSASLQLKTLIIHNFGSWPDEQEEPNLNIDEFIESWTEELELIELLLKSCKLLEKVIIRTVPMPDGPLKSKLLLSIAKKLLEIPRASVTAKISLLESMQPFHT